MPHVGQCRVGRIVFGLEVDVYKLTFERFYTDDVTESNLISFKWFVLECSRHIGKSNVEDDRAISRCRSNVLLEIAMRLYKALL